MSIDSGKYSLLYHIYSKIVEIDYYSDYLIIIGIII